MREYSDTIEPPFTNRWGCVPKEGTRRCQGTTKLGEQCRRAAMWNSNCCEVHHVGPLWQADFAEIEARVLAHLERNDMIVTDMKRDFVNDFVNKDHEGGTITVVTTELGDVPVRAIVNDLRATGKDAAAYALAAITTLLRYRELAVAQFGEDNEKLRRKLKKLKRRLKK